MEIVDYSSSMKDQTIPIEYTATGPLSLVKLSPVINFQLITKTLQDQFKLVVTLWDGQNPNILSKYHSTAIGQ